LRAGGSEAEIDPEVRAGVGRRAEFGEAVEPCGLVRTKSASQQCSVGGKPAVGSVAVSGEFGVDGAQAGVGELVLDVPLKAQVEFGPELLEGLFAAGDLGFGLTDVVGETVDLILGGGLLLAAVAAELGERPELFEALFGVVEPVVGPVQLLLGVFEGSGRDWQGMTSGRRDGGRGRAGRGRPW
jgi:hypothetical protein